jgi:hypothetical protein
MSSPTTAKISLGDTLGRPSASAVASQHSTADCTAARTGSVISMAATL